VIVAPSTEKTELLQARHNQPEMLQGFLVRFGWSVASSAIFVAVWWLAAAIVDSRYLPAPLEVLNCLIRDVLNGEMPYHISVTLARVLASFSIAMAIGSAVGIVMGSMRRVDRLFDGWLILFLNLPALVTIILCYVWFGLNEVAAVTAVALNKIPNAAVTLREGARALDRDYLEMAQVYGFDRWKTLRHVILPQLAPYFAASARSGLALVWKIVLVVELMGRSSGVGFQLFTYFQVFDVANILAYALSFIVIVQGIELLILQPWERSVSRWRK
jgi:NitT/TauT family transport system permease protein